MIFRKLSAILVIALMLPFLWVTTEAQGQTVCPGVDHPTGWLRMDVIQDTGPDDSYVDSRFTAGLYGSIEAYNGNVIGDLDWMYNNDSFTGEGGDGTSTTNEVDGQVVTWWSQANSRNTYVQFRNETGPVGQDEELGSDPLGAPIPLGVHVQVFGPDCTEILNFCDFYTPKDTHVYNLGDLVTNAGQEIGTNTLQGIEGFLTITPVVNCGTDDRAIDYDDFGATVRMIDTANDVDYGVNAWGRDAVSGGVTCTPTDGAGDGVAASEFNGAVTVGGLSTDPNSVDAAIGDARILTGLDGCKLNPLQPTQLSQNFSTIGAGFPSTGTDVVFLSFRDVYNADAGVIGYQPAALTTTYLTDIIDDQENLLSCPAIETCFARLGVDDVLPVSEDFVPPSTDEVCDDGIDNDMDGDTDCLDSDCETAESCETGEGECSDGIDNDMDGDTDCADAGCDGFDNCEFGEETLCDDGIDNDADGLTDADDPDCQAADDGGTTGDDGGDGGGCTVASAVTASTAAANFLLPLLPLAGAYGIRRFRRRNSK